MRNDRYYNFLKYLQRVLSEIELMHETRLSVQQNSRHAPEPVDHLTGKMVAECLDRIKALTDEREAIRAKLRVSLKKWWYITASFSLAEIITLLNAFTNGPLPPPKLMTFFCFACQIKIMVLPRENNPGSALVCTLISKVV